MNTRDPSLLSQASRVLHGPAARPILALLGLHNPVAIAGPTVTISPTAPPTGQPAVEDQGKRPLSALPYTPSL